MIHFCTTHRHAYTIEDFLAGWGARLAPLVRVHTYEELFSQPIMRRGSWIFADLERLDLGARQILQHYFVAARDEGYPVFNEPVAYRQRYELLRALWTRRANQGNVFLVDESLDEVRFPVFLRRANEHDGALTELILDARELDSEIARLRSRYPDDELVAVEWVDYRMPDGRYYKYGAYRVGHEILPAHLVAGEEWMLKRDAYLDHEVVTRELEFLASDSWSKELDGAFRVANVDFGRIDFAFVDGSLHVFEVNTNPSLHLTKSRGHPRFDAKRRSLGRLAEKLAGLAETIPSGSSRIVVSRRPFRPIRFAQARARHLAYRRRRAQARARRSDDIGGPLNAACPP